MNTLPCKQGLFTLVIGWWRERECKLNDRLLKEFKIPGFIGDSEVSESLDRCLECMHTSEVCVIPYTSDTADKEQSVSSESGLQCEIQLLSFCKVCDLQMPIINCRLLTCIHRSLSSIKSKS